MLNLSNVSFHLLSDHVFLCMFLSLSLSLAIVSSILSLPTFFELNSSDRPCCARLVWSSWSPPYLPLVRWQVRRQRTGIVGIGAKMDRGATQRPAAAVQLTTEACPFWWSSLQYIDVNILSCRIKNIATLATDVTNVTSHKCHKC